MVEFALVIPLFVVLLFALIDFGRLEFSYMSLTHAAREMARSAAIPETCSTPPTSPCNAAHPPSQGFGTSDKTLNSNTVDGSFKNFEGFIVSTLNASTDNVTITVKDRACVAGTGPCVFSASNPVICTLPLDSTSCAVPNRFGMAGGSVEVAATMQFTFNPLFQNRLTGMIDASFVQQFAVLKTTARAYIE